MVVPPFYDAPDLDTFKAAAARDPRRPRGYRSCSTTSRLPRGCSLTAAEIASPRRGGGGPLPQGHLRRRGRADRAPAAHADKITAFNGWDTLTFYGIAGGAKGSVWGATNCHPRAVQPALGDAWPWTRRPGPWPRAVGEDLADLPAARAVQLRRCSQDRWLELTGYSAGPVRSPSRCSRARPGQLRPAAAGRGRQGRRLTPQR